MMNATVVFKDDVVRSNRVVNRPDLFVSFDELNDLMGMRYIDEIEARFVR